MTTSGTVRVREESTGAVLAERARWARGGRERRKGLLGTTSLPRGDGLILDRAFQVHTIGMAYPIDVVFCSGDWKVRHVIRAMKPGRMSRIVLARYAIELPAGTVTESLTPGDQLAVGQEGLGVER